MANKFNWEDYPNLFAEVVMANGAVKGQFEVFQTTLKPKLISNVNLVPYIGDRWVVIRLSNQEWEIPGGTVEPGTLLGNSCKRTDGGSGGGVGFSSTVRGMKVDINSRATFPSPLAPSSFLYLRVAWRDRTH